MKKLDILSLLLLGAFACTSCNDYLDEMPDNRAELNTEFKITSLLVSAYPTKAYIMCAEMSSDNADDYGDTNPYGSRFYEQLYNWRDVTESTNESPNEVWSACYSAIAAANQALDAIEEMGSPASLNGTRGEALVCRAYGHFILVNLFAHHYSPQHADKDLGITYIEKPEKDLNPKYERNTVAEVYAKIETDLRTGIPLLDDANFSVPKYHFNKKAANAFAARFFLYYQKWDEVIQYATAALGSAPQTMLRNYIEMAALPRKLNTLSTNYINATHKCNFLLITAYSQLGTVFGPYYSGSRYAHGALIAKNETLLAEGPWGRYTNNTYHIPPLEYGGTNLDKVLLPRLPYLFETTDPVANTGYTRTVYAGFTAEETLLNRAEAYLLKQEYANGLADMKLWANNTVKRGSELTEASILAWADKFDYYTPTAPTPKKRLNPDFALEEGKQESLIQALLFLRRYETIHTGLRWFDVKRYGIEVTRRTIQGGEVASIGNQLLKRDNRCAIQIPADVVAAGLTPNPR